MDLKSRSPSAQAPAAGPSSIHLTRFLGSAMVLGLLPSLRTKQPHMDSMTLGARSKEIHQQATNHLLSLLWKVFYLFPTTVLICKRNT